MKAKHAPCACGCGELADECMTGRNPLGAFIIDPSVVKVFGVDDDDVGWAAYGREAFLQNWRKRAELAEARLDRLRCRHGNLAACEFCRLDAKDEQ